MEDKTRKEIDVTMYDGKEVEALKEENSEIETVVELEDVTDTEPEDAMETIADNLGALCIAMMQIRDHLGNIAELMLKQTGK